MHDFDYDVMQKKRIAHGARHMRRGSQSKKCSLPSDYMTPAEWKRRNGPVSTYKLDKPMSWEEFKEMPDDLKIRYIRSLRKLYGANDRMFGEMFFIHFSHFALIRKNLGITERMPKVTGEAAERRDAMWKAFCNGVVGGGDSVKETEPCEPVCDEQTDENMGEAPEVREAVQESAVPEEEPIPVEIPREVMFERAKESIKPDPMSLDNLTATFSGDFSPELFLHWIARLPMPDGKVRIRVEVEAL